MLEQLYVKKQPCKMVAINPCSRLLVTSTDENAGVLLRTTDFKDVNLEDNFKQFSVFDFDISNIMATGSTQLLKPVSFRNGDVDNMVNQVDNIAAGIDAAVEKVE